MAKVPHEAQHHPEAFEEAVAIARAGSYAHLNAVTQIGPLFDARFDGVDAQGRSTWVGASLRVEDFCSHVPGTSRPRLYAETFWGSDDQGVVPSFAVLDSGRPVLLAVVQLPD